MNYLQFPIQALDSPLTATEKSVLLCLCFFHYRFCRRDFTKEFWITDRELASRVPCNKDTVRLAKQKMKRFEILDYYVGHKNITHYKMNKDFWL